MTRRAILWGTYDLGKPRTRIMRDALERSDLIVAEVHTPIWEGVEDKSQLSIAGWTKRVFRWLANYPRLVARYLRAPAHDVVVVPYMGHLDVLVLWPFAKLRGARIVWDAFLSLYESVVRDRAMVGRANPLAWLLYAWEWLACRAADKIVLDTAAHARLFEARFGVSREKLAHVFVGAEGDRFVLPTAELAGDDGQLRVLFYGQFIPLHGIETIIEAARLARDLPIEWQIVGDGQEAGKIAAMLEEQPLEKLRWTRWVDYDALVGEIAAADVCLGIFGTSEKAARVIPNKAFQVLAAGKPLVTRDSPAMRELVREEDEGVALVEAGNPSALLEAVKTMDAWATSRAIAARFSLEVLSRQWAALVVD